jgi:hypothetical protein
MEEIKVCLKDIDITKHDIQTCRDFNDYEDMGFYQTRLHELYDELVELVKTYIEVNENEDK